MDYILWYDAPAENTAADWETKTLPIGNSSIGANIFGRYDTERITLNEKSFWTGGPSILRPSYNGGNLKEKGKYGQTIRQIRTLFAEGNISAAQSLCDELTGDTDGYGGYQLFGNLFFDFGVTEKDKISGYRRSLNLNTGIATVSYKKNNTLFQREQFVSYPDQTMVLHLTALGEDSLHFSLSLVPENTAPATRSTEITAVSDRLEVFGLLDDNQLQYSAFLTVLLPEGGSVFPKDNIGLTICNAKEVTILLSLGTDYKNSYPSYRSGETMEELRSRTRMTVLNAAKKTFTELRSAHVSDISEAMARVDVTLGQPIFSGLPTDRLLTAYNSGTLSKEERSYLESLLYQYGRYLLLSSSRGNTLPANLQGIWTGKNGNPWGSDYHINVNLQMNYWHVYNTDLAECALPLIDYVDSLRKPGRVTAEIYFGVISDEKHPENGFTANTQATPFGWTCPGWSFDWGWSPAAVPWILQNIWEYYEYTQDVDLLKNRIYPIMKEEALFYQHILTRDSDGALVSSPSFSPEQGPRTNGNTYEQTLVWQLFTDTITAAKIVGESPDLITSWEKVLAELKPPISIGTDGQIKEWYEETSLGSVEGAENYQHRHLSHLLGLYPGDLISEETPEWFAAALISMKNRTDRSTGWAMGQRINSWARLKNGKKVYALIKNLFADGIYPNLWDTHPPFQIDGNFGYTAGVTEALLQSNTGYIHLLPALPEEWYDGSFRGLIARGNFKIDAIWHQKTISEVHILSQCGGTCTVQFASCSNVSVTDGSGNAVSFSELQKDRISFETTKGETYLIRSAFFLS